jgi:hypothetical protein
MSGRFLAQLRLSTVGNERPSRPGGGVMAFVYPGARLAYPWGTQARVNPDHELPWEVEVHSA